MTVLLTLVALAAGAVVSTTAQMAMVDGRGYFTDWPGCVPSLETQASYCVFPITNAQFVADQRFEARVEVHTPYTGSAAADPYPTVPAISLTVYVNGDMSAGIDIGDRRLSVADATVTPTTNAYTFVYTSGFNETVGGHAPPHAVTKYSYGWTWKGLRAVAGVHTVVLTVAGSVKAKLTWKVAPVSPRLAKNVILFVGDGLNTGIVTAARVLSRGMVNGATRSDLHMDGMDRLSYVSTNGYDSIITDSANSAASYASGQKGPVNSVNVYGDTTSSTLDDPKAEMLTEMAARKYGNAKFGIGVVTTSEVQDATPAAFFAHTRRRADKAEITRQFIEGFDRGTWSAVPEIDVLLGGGSQYFYPRMMLNVTDGAGAQVFCRTAGATCAAADRTTDASQGVAPVQVSNGGNSISGRNFYAEAAAKGYALVHDRAELAATASKNKKVLGIFHYANNDVWYDRHEKTANIAQSGNPRFYDSYAAYAARPAPMMQPDLSEMTSAAIKVLDRRGEDGFFLMVEASSIDKAEHPFDNERAIDELIDMDNAVGVALEYARAHGDTLVLVTADHGHAFDVFGTVDTRVFDAMDAMTTSPAEKKRLRASAVGFYNRAGFPDVVDVDGDGFPDNFATARYTLATGYADVPNMKEQFRAHNSYRRPSLGDGVGSFALGDAADDNNVGGNNHGVGFSRNLPSGTEGVHTMQDVPLYAEGPGSELLHSSMVNTEVFQVIAKALGLGA